MVPPQAGLLDSCPLIKTGLHNQIIVLIDLGSETEAMQVDVRRAVLLLSSFAGANERYATCTRPGLIEKRNLAALAWWKIKRQHRVLTIAVARLDACCRASWIGSSVVVILDSVRALAVSCSWMTDFNNVALKHLILEYSMPYLIWNSLNLFNMQRESVDTSYRILNRKFGL